MGQCSPTSHTSQGYIFIFLLIFLGKERERETYQLPPIHAPNWGSNPQPRSVPRPGIGSKTHLVHRTTFSQLSHTCQGSRLLTAHGKHPAREEARKPSHTKMENICGPTCPSESEGQPGVRANICYGRVWESYIRTYKASTNRYEKGDSPTDKTRHVEDDPMERTGPSLVGHVEATHCTPTGRLGPWRERKRSKPLEF